jgi:capsule polysaccharide modification protein KpsS
MFFKNSNKDNKINAMFLSANESDEAFMKEIYDYTTSTLTHKVQPFFRRVTNFFVFEWIFAVQKNIEYDLVAYISEYGFLKHIQTNPNKFFTRFYFDCIAKMHFINSYSYLRKHNIDILYVKDDNSIPHIACIVAAHNLKIEVKILHEGYREEMLFVDSNATRFRNSLPRNPNFYQNLELEAYSVEKNNTNLIIVLLQPEDSMEILFDSPLVKSQKYFLTLISNLAKEHLDYQFVIFHSNFEFHNTENVSFLNEGFATLLPSAKAIITVNSPQAIHGFEFNKPIIVLGNAFYAMNGLTIPVTSEEELFNAINQLDSFEFDERLAHKYIAFVQNYYAIRCTNLLQPTKEDCERILLGTLPTNG